MKNNFEKFGLMRHGRKRAVGEEVKSLEESGLTENQQK